MRFLTKIRILILVKKRTPRFCGAIPHLFERLFLISWENIRDCHITMPLSLKTMVVQTKGDQWNKRFTTVQVYWFCNEDDYENQIFSILSSAKAWTSVILAGKRDSRRHSKTGFRENDQREYRSGGNKLSNVRRFIILIPGEGLTSCSINNRTDFFGEKSTMKLSVVSVSLRTRVKTLS